MSRRTLMFCLMLPLVLGACATRTDLEAVRSDLDNLSQGSTSTNTAEALRIARENRQAIADLRGATARAERDAAESRRMLEALDQRMGGELGGDSLK